MRLGFASLTLACGLALTSAAAAQEMVPAPLPPPAPTGESPTEVNSPALLVTGTVLAGLGVGAAATGAAFWASDPCTEPGVPEDQCGMGFGRIAGLFLMGGGGLLVVTGAPMIVAGAWQVPASEPGVPPTRAELRLGAGRAELGVTF